MTLSETRQREHAVGVPDSEVPQVAKRRRFTADYKLRIIAEAEACTGLGEVGALLRREGLYSSHLAHWRKQARQGLLEGLDKRRGRKPNDPLVAENAKLRRQNERLERRLAQAEAVIELQKKLSEILGIDLPTDDSEPTT
jgi:transposase-like protein